MTNNQRSFVIVKLVLDRKKVEYLNIASQHEI